MNFNNWALGKLDLTFLTVALLCFALSCGAPHQAVP
jgi:hypothetical protein